MAKNFPTEQKTLARIFANRSIETNEIAFYNSSSFLQAEQNDPDMLALYACHVDQMNWSSEQLDRNAACIEALCEIVHDYIKNDNQTGICVDVSGMLSKFLEMYGIWNYSMSGSMNFHDPALKVEGNTTYFWALDMSVMPGHVWLVAPPYAVIDLSVKKQPYTANELDLVPEYILQKFGQEVEAKNRDHMSPERMIMSGISPFGSSNKMYLQADQRIKKTEDRFPASQFMINNTTYRYLPVGVSMTDAMTIDDLLGRKWQGKYPAEIFEKIVKPQMAKVGFEVTQ